jgi:hypothetical protein
VLLEQIHAPDIVAQRVGRLVAADLGQLEQRRASLGRAGQEAAAQAVAAVGGRWLSALAKITLTHRLIGSNH